MAEGGWPTELILTAAGSAITVGLGGILAFCIWIVRTNYKILAAQNSLVMRMRLLEKRVDMASKNIWKAEQQLAALWPLVPGANERTSDKYPKRRSSHG